MIYINARFLSQPITGVQRFAIEISLQLSEILGRSQVVFLSPKGILDKQLVKNLNVKVIGKNKGHIWEQVDLPYFLKSQGHPLLLNLSSTAPMFYKNQIVTHHDITYVRYPESFSRKFRYLYKLIIPRMLKNSKLVLTVSEFSKSEISEYYKIPKEKIRVIYNGVNLDIFHPKPEKLPFILENGFEIESSNYFLAVSSRNFHKNFHGLLRSFKTIDGKKYRNVKLYIVGANEISSFRYKDLEDIVEDERIHFLGRVSDSDLVKLYSNAMGFIFPSFYEGFGIPPIEAQACSCPVISSDKASLPEILNDSAIFIDPNSENSLRKAIMDIILDKKLRENLIIKGQENVRRFSWFKSAQEIEKIISNNSSLNN